MRDVEKSGDLELVRLLQGRVPGVLQVGRLSCEPQLVRGSFLSKTPSGQPGGSAARPAPAVQDSPQSGYPSLGAKEEQDRELQDQHPSIA